MKIKIIAAILLLSVSSAVFAETVSLTATDRVKYLADEESAWRWGSGTVKLVAGGAVVAAGYPFVTVRDNPIAAALLIPLGIIIITPGITLMGWGGYDLLFGSREYENQYDKLKLSTEPTRESEAMLYLKEKSAKDKLGRQPSFWNAFGLFSLFETPAEREYNGYLKERSLSR